MKKYDKLLNEIKELKKNIKAYTNPNIDIKINDFEIHFVQSNISYIPSLTHKLFHADKSKTRIVMGAFGSGKTTAMIAEIIHRACRMPKCKDGVRRYKCLVIRNTYNDLKRTCLESWLTWCNNLGTVYPYNQSPIHYRHVFNDQKGTVELKIEFMSIDNPKQLRQLKSFETTDVWLSELSELNYSVLKTVLGRVGRYPSHVQLGNNIEFSHDVFAETNAPNQRHWIKKIEDTAFLEYEDGVEKHRIYRAETNYRNNDIDQCSIVKIYHQPPALLKNDKKEWLSNSYAENIKNLPGGYQYYFNMLQNGEEFVRVYVQGKYGVVRDGQVVYQKYNDDIHTTEKIDIQKNIELIYGIDYGIATCAILVCQYVAGQLRVIKEFCGEHMYISDLANEQFIPWLEANCTKNRYEQYNAWGVDDCAQTDRGREQLTDLGLDIRAARTNAIEPRLASVHTFLGRITNKGYPSILISRSGCPILREGFNGQYCLKSSRINGENVYQDVPNKLHPISDIHDCLQYVALEFTGQTETKPKKYDIKSKVNQSRWL